jgi:hypothetical protein
MLELHVDGNRARTRNTSTYTGSLLSLSCSLLLHLPNPEQQLRFQLSLNIVLDSLLLNQAKDRTSSCRPIVSAHQHEMEDEGVFVPKQEPRGPSEVMDDIPDQPAQRVGEGSQAPSGDGAHRENRNRRGASQQPHQNNGNQHAAAEDRGSPIVISDDEDEPEGTISTLLLSNLKAN